VNGNSILAERVAWLFFGATSLQLAFLHPYLVLLPGERTNLFSGLLCALSLAATAWAATKADILRNQTELAICLVLAALILLSGFHSQLPLANSWRGLVLLSSGLGGFWGARILLATEARQRSFLRLCLLMLSGILLLILPAYLLSGKVPLFLDSNPHPLANKIMLLWFAPLTLLWGRPAQKFWGAFLIGLSYLMFSVMELRSAVLLPLIIGVLAVFCGGLRLKHLLLILLGAGVILFYFVRHLPKEKIGKGYEPAYYRVENYPFSWHIAVSHPFLGIGLLTPRAEFLKDYKIKYPYVTRGQFEHSLKEIIVADNMFLTFMAGAGFPFLLLYSFSLGALMTRLVGSLGDNPSARVVPPLALMLPLVTALLSFFVYDILLHPQVCWFFSVLLGLIPMNRG
jgi:hypothetical protein